MPKSAKKRETIKRPLTIIPLVFLFCITFGCQQDEEAIINTIEDMVGIWKGVFRESVAFRQFDADGTFKCALENIERLQDSSSLKYSGVGSTSS